MTKSYIMTFFLKYFDMLTATINIVTKISFCRQAEVKHTFLISVHVLMISSYASILHLNLLWP